MAMFDRRLLAYFDGGGLAGETTLQDRITDYQRDLAEIEHALLKYQAVVGGSRARVRARARDEWIAKHQHSRPVVKDMYGYIAEAEGDRADEQAPAGRRGSAGHAGGGSGSARRPAADPYVLGASLRPSPDASQGSRRSSQLLPQDAAGQEAPRRGSGRHAPDAAAAAGPGRRAAAAAGAGGRAGPGAAAAAARPHSPRPPSPRSHAPQAAPTRPPGSPRAEAPPAAGARAEGGRRASAARTERGQAAAPPRSIWTQLDKMRLPRQRTGELGRYLVSVGWDGVRGSERTTEVKDGIERDGMEECVWRQQVQLTGQPGAQTVLLRVLRVGRSGSDQALVGELRLDAVSDAGTKPDPWYDLAGKDGLKSDAKVKLRLVEPKPDAAAPSARIAPSAVVQDPHAAADARRPPDKAAGAPAAKSPPMQRGRATSHLSHFQRGGAPLPTDEEGSDGEEEEEESELADEEEEEEEEQSESEQEQSAASAGTAGKSVGTGGRAAGRARTPQQRAGTPQRARA